LQLSALEKLKTLEMSYTFGMQHHFGGGELLVVEILVAFSTFNIRDATNDNQYSGDAAVLRESESVSGKEPVPKNQ
jgi:hypothetical protein